MGNASLGQGQAPSTEQPFGTLIDSSNVSGPPLASNPILHKGLNADDVSDSAAGDVTGFRSSW